jgi:DNA-binding NarL/FixJ family response regulator
VVIVDQWPLVRLGIGRSLPSLSFRILEEADGVNAARAAIRRRRPELVVMGDHLGGDGPGLVKMAKEEGAAVVALVDRPTRAHLAALATAGCDGILTASAPPEELLAAAERVLTGDRALSAELVPALAGVVIRQEPATPATDLLTDRERQVLACLVRGARNEEIAAELFLSPATVKSHLSSIYTKLEVRSRHEATALALKLGLVRP